MTPRKVIIDTDPGIDDVHALALALAADPEDLEVLLISVTWGNVEAKSCLRNTVSAFHVIQKELDWRKQHGRSSGFRGLEKSKPLVAIGAQGPLDGTESSADYFHGRDGLAGIHDSHPHLSPTEAWEHLFEEPPEPSIVAKAADQVIDGKTTAYPLFRPSSRPGHLEILALLAENPQDTIEIVAVGPLTTIAQAAAADPVTFLRVRRLVVMGGAITKPGNMTPLAEFNFYADPIAAARVLALTSPVPTSTMPRPDTSGLAPYSTASNLGTKRLKMVLFPLDITEQHATATADYTSVTNSLVGDGSPLAEWLSHLFLATVKKMQSLNTGQLAAVTLHDPICVWYVLRESKEAGLWEVSEDQDIRVEVNGQWTKGGCISDRRDRQKMEEIDFDENNLKERTGDDGGWLSHKRGNRVGVCTRTPGTDAFTKAFLDTVFGGR